MPEAQIPINIRRRDLARRDCADRRRRTRYAVAARKHAVHALHRAAAVRNDAAALFRKSAFDKMRRLNRLTDRHDHQIAFDAHILLAKEQIKDEVIRIAQLLDEVYNLFNLPYTIELSTMPDDHIGTEEDWKKAEAALADAITSIGKSYVVNPGDGAFYGPKLDFHIEDSLGRTWQCGTIQLDYQLPGRFNLVYTGSDGEKYTPVMIHRVVFGSIERFIGIITEHFAGAFPLWLAPVQARIMTITDRSDEFAKKVQSALEAEGIRTEIDLRNEKIGKKIAEGRVQKIPYLLVIGDKEAENGAVAVRSREKGDEGAMSVEAFLARVKDEVKSKKM